MNKFLRKAMVVALAGTMTMGMGTTVFAADVTTPASGFNTSVDKIADTATINLLKDYVRGDGSATDSVSPEETFTFTIENYGLWNVGEDGKGKAKYTKDDMPTFENGSTNTFTIQANAGDAGKTASKPSTQISVPKYAAVGDYWYKVTETQNKVAGVIYGTNDSQKEDLTVENGGHDGVYYLHVQVTNNDNAKGENDKFIRTVTLHKTAPALTIDNKPTTNTDYENWYANNGSDNQTAKKVDAIQNKYYAGSLKITKEVEGNAGDKNELFKVKVVFNNGTGAEMKSDIKYKNFYNEDGTEQSEFITIGWSNNATEKSVEFYVKDGTTVTFSNIPYGVSYTITETQPKDDKYTHEFAYTASQETGNGKFNGVETAVDKVTPEGTSTTEEGSTENQAQAKWNAATATGSISDASDEVTLTNTKVSTIDIGVITSNAPYVAVLILAAAALVIYTRRRRDMFEE